MKLPSLTAPRLQQAIIAVAGATHFAGGILMGTAMAVYVGRAGTPFAVSMVLAAYYLGMMVFAPVWGAVADVTGRRRAVLVGTGLLATLAILPLAMADGVWLPIGLRGLYAVFAAGFAPVMLTIVSERGGESGRGRSIGFFNSARASGFASGQLFVGILLGLLVPASLYLVIAAVALTSTLAVVFLDDPTPRTEAQPSIGELFSEVRRRLLPAVDDRDHFRTNGLRWLYVALALRNMTVLGISSLLPVYLVITLGVSEFLMGVLLAINPVSQIVWMYVFGRASDTAGRKPLIVAGMAGSGLYALVIAGAVVPDEPLLRATVVGGALLLLGASFSAMTTGALAFIGDIAPATRESELMGLRTTSKGVGGVLGPPLLGAIATVASIQVAYAVGSVLALSAAGLVGVALIESRPDLGLVGGPAPGDD